MNDEIKNSIGRLKRNPLFQMSLGSKELFHSNIIAWLMESNIHIAEIIFQHWGLLTKEQKLVSIKIEREKYYIDLLIDIKLNDSNEMLVVIENKLKSIPNKEQLDKYYESINKKKVYAGKEIQFILLTLVQPKFNVKPDKWNIKNYSTLSNALIQAKNLGSTEIDFFSINHFLKAYKSFIDTLVLMNNAVLKTRHYDYYSKNHLVMNDLRTIKLHDIFLKIAHHKISEKVISKLKVYPQLRCTSLNESESEFDFSVYSGFSNSSGLTGLRILIYKNKKIKLFIGVQLQAKQFRYYTEVISSDGSIAETKSHINFSKDLEVKNLWFLKTNKIKSNLSIEKDRNGNEKRGKGIGRSKSGHTFCEYSKGAFLYRYDVLDDQNLISKIEDSFVKATAYILNNKDQILQVAKINFHSNI
ncbi:PD-(D/E)XK nuclease family protein [Marinicella gelatinilytica]|uniref:PD-(D/E)XK nuclease family protein n=1 Tax=Marinicella gelatinilytica TaxID=2996017 RepID=UPI002260BC5E|nr:PD-(D/E)XK nuclease family protein [Marinicella gelatinilytica]MCX7545347.1 PD-(D/E)XK nuclease family protein [Marinicella gelatinilytica]